MTTDIIIVTTLVAVGTYLLRWLPTKIDFTRGKSGGALSRFLAATGPAAITALAAASFLPLVTPDPGELLPLALGAGAVLLAYLWRRDVALATIAGAIAYGVVFALMPA